MSTMHVVTKLSQHCHNYSCDGCMITSTANGRIMGIFRGWLYAHEGQEHKYYLAAAMLSYVNERSSL